MWKGKLEKRLEEREREREERERRNTIKEKTKIGEIKGRETVNKGNREREKN